MWFCETRFKVITALLLGGFILNLVSRTNFKNGFRRIWHILSEACILWSEDKPIWSCLMRSSSLSWQRCGLDLLFVSSSKPSHHSRVLFKLLTFRTFQQPVKEDSFQEFSEYIQQAYGLNESGSSSDFWISNQFMESYLRRETPATPSWTCMDRIYQHKSFQRLVQ